VGAGIYNAVYVVKMLWFLNCGVALENDCLIIACEIMIVLLEDHPNISELSQLEL